MFIVHLHVEVTFSITLTGFLPSAPQMEQSQLKIIAFSCGLGGKISLADKKGNFNTNCWITIPLPP